MTVNITFAPAPGLASGPVGSLSVITTGAGALAKVMTDETYTVTDR